MPNYSLPPTNIYPLTVTPISTAMSREREELAAEPDDFEEDASLDSIGILEYLIKPGKTYGQCHVIFRTVH